MASGLPIDHLIMMQHQGYISGTEIGTGILTLYSETISREERFLTYVVIPTGVNSTPSLGAAPLVLTLALDGKGILTETEAKVKSLEKEHREFL